MTQTIITPLSPEEKTKKAECEAIIKTGLGHFIPTLKAFVELRDLQLYRDEYGTFEAYCEEKWEISRSTGHRWVAALAISLQTEVHGFVPPNERAARPLNKLKKEPEKLEVAARVLATQEKVDAKAVEAVVKAVQKVSQEEVVEHPETGDMVNFKELDEKAQAEVIQQVVSVQEQERAEMLAKAKPYVRPRDVPPPPAPDSEDDDPSPPAEPTPKVYGKDPWKWLNNCLEIHKDHFSLAFHGEWDSNSDRQKWVVKIISKGSSTIFAQGEGMFPRTAVIACIEDFRRKE